MNHTARSSKGRRGKSTQQTVLKHAEEILGELGYDGFSIQEVVARSGVSVGSIYHHFGNKHGLIEAIVQSFYQEGISELEAMAETAPSLEAGVHDFMQLSRKRFIKHRGLYRALVARASLDPESWRPMRKLREYYDAKAVSLLMPHLGDLDRDSGCYRIQLVMQDSIALMTHIAVFKSSPLKLDDDQLLQHLAHMAKETLRNESLIPPEHWISPFDDTGKLTPPIET